MVKTIVKFCPLPLLEFWNHDQTQNEKEENGVGYTVDGPADGSILHNVIFDKEIKTSYSTQQICVFWQYSKW